ncbi:hypothetical protein RR48_10339 [Papilio machaon]|uniref:Uncharacterized protein n=1 Tax=Papilio machaon TaxID=76193 RepID=A0A194RHE1_PAPMA|nr:hypothetical protein RR48_10339 [Papilio machaon]
MTSSTRQARACNSRFQFVPFGGEAYIGIVSCGAGRSLAVPGGSLRGRSMASPQASPRAGSPASAPRSPAPAHAVLATMTPVQPAHDYYPHKVEMDSDDGYPPEAHSYRHSPHELAAYAPDNKVQVQPDVYDQGMDSIDEKTPIDLIYEDDKQTVIYTTTPDQKRVEMISGHLEDGQLVGGGGQLVDGGVSVVVGAPGQGTVLVLADHVVDELGQVITIPSQIWLGTYQFCDKNSAESFSSRREAAGSGQRASPAAASPPHRAAPPTL